MNSLVRLLTSQHLFNRRIPSALYCRRDLFALNVWALFKHILILLLTLVLVCYSLKLFIFSIQLESETLICLFSFHSTLADRMLKRLLKCELKDQTCHFPTAGKCCCVSDNGTVSAKAGQAESLTGYVCHHVDVHTCTWCIKALNREIHCLGSLYWYYSTLAAWSVYKCVSSRIVLMSELERWAPRPDMPLVHGW